LEPICCEYAPVKHHDTGVLLAWLVTLAIVTARDRIGRRYTRPRHASKRHLE